MSDSNHSRKKNSLSHSGINNNLGGASTNDEGMLEVVYDPVL